MVFEKMSPVLGSIWMDKFAHVWASLGEFGQKTTLDEFGRVWI